MALLTSCRCDCGQGLSGRQVVHREPVRLCGAWKTYVLSFRCSRCHRLITRKFETRSEEGTVTTIEPYERGLAGALGPITDEEIANLPQALNDPLPH